MNFLENLPKDKITVSPSILAADFSNLGTMLGELDESGIQMVHLDVMDGHFVPNISFGVPVIKSIRSKSALFFDTHLMISHPLKYAESFVKAGSDLLTFHLECADDISDTVDAIHELGADVGISLKPSTPAEAVFPWLDKIELVLVMSVEPGFGGQSFMTGQMPKVAAIKRQILKTAPHVHLEIDGGIDAKTVIPSAQNGVNIVVAGTSVFKNPLGIRHAVRDLENASGAINTKL